MKELISVIIPVYNRAELIVRTLDSVRNQSILPDEIIVVDNGSTDSTHQVVENWIKSNNKDISINLVEEKMPGAAAARQRGFEISKGEYVIFLDSDDEMLPGLIEKTQIIIKQNPEIDLICWPVIIINENGEIRRPPFDCHHAMENHLIHSLLRTVGYIVKRKFMAKSGGWNVCLKVWDDLEAGFRLLYNQPQIAGINEPLVKVNSHSASITGVKFSSKSGDWEKTLGAIRKINTLGNHLYKKKIEKIISYREVILAASYYKEGAREKARLLFEKVIRKNKGIVRAQLLATYHYTKIGGRGAWRLFFSPTHRFFSRG